MRTKAKKGDLVHVPANTLLITFGADGVVKDYEKLPAPVNLLVVHADGHLYKVMNGSKEWFVKAKDVNKID